MPQVRQAGFAMLDVLVALLLLAVVLTGACATLIQTMRHVQGSLLATRAADLAADLMEELQGATSAAQAGAAVAAWQVRVGAVLPVAGLAPDEYASLRLAPPVTGDTASASVPGYELTLRWRDGPRGSLRGMSLPVAMALQVPAP